MLAVGNMNMFMTFFLPFRNSRPSGGEIEVGILLWLGFLEYFGSKVWKQRLTKLIGANVKTGCVN